MKRAMRTKDEIRKKIVKLQSLKGNYFKKGYDHGYVSCIKMIEVLRWVLGEHEGERVKKPKRKYKNKIGSLVGCRHRHKPFPYGSASPKAILS